MSEPSEALKAMAMKAAEDAAELQYPADQAEVAAQLNSEHAHGFYDGYLRATSDALAVIEAERQLRENGYRPMMTQALRVVASKIRNPEPELPEAVSNAILSLTMASEIARRDDRRIDAESHSSSANALEAAARRGGWR